MKEKTDKNLYDFDHESKDEKKLKRKKQKAEKKSASKKEKHKDKHTKEKNEPKRYEDEIIIGVIRKEEPKNKNKSKEVEKNRKQKRKKIEKNYENEVIGLPKNVKNKKEKINKNRIKVEKNKKNSNINKQDKIKDRIEDIEKKQRNKQKIKTLKNVVIIILVVTAIILFALSPVFNITKIDVVGNSKITVQEIISLSGINLQENLFKVNNSKSRENIKQNPYINTVEINKKIPGTIEIVIQEREANFLLEYGNGYVYINNQGYMLELSSTKLQLPIITGTITPKENYKEGNRLEEEDLKKLSTAIKIMNSANTNEIANLITTINIQNQNNYTLYFQTEKKTAYLGDCTDLETRMLYLTGIIKSEKDIEGEIFVNMNLNTDNAFFREKI